MGALLGLLAACCLKFGGPMGPMLALAALALCTGGLHEDGLADVFDGLRSGRSREKMLAILKDSRIGAHGALALTVSLGWRWQALSAMHGDAWLRLPAALAISRGAMVLLAVSSPAAGDGLGRAFIESIPRWTLFAVLPQIVLAAAACGWPAGLAVATANLVLLAVLRAWFAARLGGVTGDCLGAACQMTEALTLAVFAWV